MKIRNDLAKSAIMEYITEMFKGFEFSMSNVAGMVVAKMFVHNNFDKLLPIISQDGYIDIDALEEIAVPEIERLGKIELPGIGTKYYLGPDDVKRLIAKLRQKGEQ